MEVISLGHCSCWSEVTGIPSLKSSQTGVRPLLKVRGTKCNTVYTFLFCFWKGVRGPRGPFALTLVPRSTVC